jgi:2-keto-4-pentenoate hydratase
MKTPYTDRGYASFVAAVPANLVGKEGFLVELIPGTRTIQLYSATATIQPIGTLFERLEGDTVWNVRLLGKQGTSRMIASGAITTGHAVKPVNGGTVVQANTGDTAIGVFVGEKNAVANDVIEVLDNQIVAF